MDVDVVEHALVELPSLLIRSGQVVRVGVREQGAEVVELLDDEVSTGCVALALRLSGGTCSAVGGGQLLSHALTDDEVDPQYNELSPKSESEPAPKSQDGPEPAKDPNEQHPDYPDRNTLGQYHRQDTVSKATEQKGLDKVDASDDFDEPVLRKQVEAHVDGVPQVRKYDGLGENPNGTYTGVEVKSPSEVTKQGLNANTQQRAFDDLVSPEHPATATITKMINGKAVKVKIEIIAVQLVTVAGE